MDPTKDNHRDITPEMYELIRRCLMLTPKPLRDLMLSDDPARTTGEVTPSKIEVGGFQILLRRVVLSPGGIVRVGNAYRLEKPGVSALELGVWDGFMCVFKVELDPQTLKPLDPKRGYYRDEELSVGRVLPALRQATVLDDLADVGRTSK